MERVPGHGRGGTGWDLKSFQPQAGLGFCELRFMVCVLVEFGRPSSPGNQGSPRRCGRTGEPTGMLGLNGLNVLYHNIPCNAEGSGDVLSWCLQPEDFVLSGSSVGDLKIKTSGSEKLLLQFNIKPGVP